MPSDKSRNEQFGLTQGELKEIIRVLEAFTDVKRALIFGSRAKGTYKRGSDIDIALVGNNLDQSITQISYQLNEELTLPYYFDVIDYSNITHQDLKDHVDRVGIQFYP